MVTPVADTATNIQHRVPVPHGGPDRNPPNESPGPLTMTLGTAGRRTPIASRAWLVV